MAASFILCIFRFFRLLLSGHQAVAIWSAAFRLQLAEFRRQRKRPVFTVVDRMFSDRSHCPRCQSGAETASSKVGAGPSHCVVLPRCLHIAGATGGGLRISESRLTYNLLFQAASEALLTIAADPKRIGARVGFLAVLHTWGQKLLQNPHS